ncbi:MAG: peptide chain release factor N(5)-glutamine methyltransferase [Gammaproteobacteria bacterium]|nr:peptide chain release factor N(5)-glutamine methyltransferase [Gammaproteobacteria bacterium]
MLAEVVEQLAGSVDDARLDAEVLLCHLLSLPRVTLYSRPETVVSEVQYRDFMALVARRRAGEPVAYLVGEREFWSLKLEVSTAVLIPRPETELLVEQTLLRIPDDAHWRVADLGTGSGAIALAVAQERARCRVVASDCSAAALAIAQRNAEQLQLNNVEFRHGSWFAPLAAEHFHVVLSNPPYIAAGDSYLQRGDLRFEPGHALVSGADGLDAIREIVATAADHLQTAGWLLLEHGYEQGTQVRALLKANGYSRIETVRDYAGHERVSVAQLGASLC